MFVLGCWAVYNTQLPLSLTPTLAPNEGEEGGQKVTKTGKSKISLKITALVILLIQIQGTSFPLSPSPNFST